MTDEATRALSPQERDLYRDLGAADGWRDAIMLMYQQLRDDLRSLRDDVRALPCRSGEACPAPSRRTRPSEEVATRRDVEDSQRIVLAEVEGTAEKTVSRRLAKRRNETRATVRWWLEIAKTLLVLLAGSGIVFAARCELPARSAAGQNQSVTRDAGQMLQK